MGTVEQHGIAFSGVGLELHGVGKGKWYWLAYVQRF